MNKKILLIATGAITLTLTGCGNEVPDGVEQIDPTRTQIYVNNYEGGYGSEWLAKVKERFEEAHKEDVIEEGKKGIQVYIDSKKRTADSQAANILDNRDDVYFTEQSSYYSLKSQGILGDITDVVTDTLSNYGETSSILDKMSSEQISYYGMSESDGKTHYYGLPHYSGFFGITYNVDLFDEKGFYFAATPTGSRLDDKFVTKTNIKKSAGPDGKSGTSDDGLPTTYDEFFELCEYIDKKGCTPFLSNGKNSKDYLNNLVNALATNYEGKEEMTKVFSMDGQVNTLATIVNGELVMDENPTTLTTENGYETSRMAGKYYGIKFLSRIMGNDSYHNDKITNTGYSHTNAQTDFLYAGYDGTTKPIAMLSDGIWWENEAKEIFQEMVDSKGDNFSLMKRKFAFMPLPQPTEEKAKATTKTTLFDHLFSLCFMKANVPEYKKSIVKEFIKFCNTDVSLVEYTITTNTPKALSYSMSEEQLSQMSYFGRSLYEIKAASDIVYPYGSSSFFANNQSRFHTTDQYFTKVNGTTNQYVIKGITDLGYSAETYFSGMYTYFKDEWKLFTK
ncbi:MAG TPA: hypothetical protein DD377_01110 [Firmicutes bacterium]|nr:hypothetical protein [Bacillota bacterium]HBM70002.1 hypothetical protein [Bacillota bacterium]